MIPYVEFAKQMRGVRPLLVDTSILIDGRIEALGQTGFLQVPLIVPQFVIDELQVLADSGDKLKRARGRRGLSIVGQLQSNPYVDISIDNADASGRSVDHMLIALARDQNMRILTTDYNLNKIAQIQGVQVLNINDLATSMRSQALPGESMQVEIVKRGESDDQGVGYMPDGTMVVVEGAAGQVGSVVGFTVTNALQTSAGRMIFGRADASATPPPSTNGEGSMQQSATNQPRSTERPSERNPGKSRRNPRR